MKIKIRYFKVLLKVLPLKFLSFTNLKVSQQPCWEFEYTLHLTEQRGEHFANFIQGAGLDHNACSSYSLF